MKGRYFWNRRTTENLKTAIDFFEQAIAKDPAYESPIPGWRTLMQFFRIMPLLLQKMTLEKLWPQPARR